MVLVYGVTLRRSRPRFRGQDPQSSACIGDAEQQRFSPSCQSPAVRQPVSHGSAARV
jgi:hypothetical protein